MAQQSSSVSQALEWWLENKVTNKIWYYPISRKDERNFLAISKRCQKLDILGPKVNSWTLSLNFFIRFSCQPMTGKKKYKGTVLGFLMKAYAKISLPVLFISESHIKIKISLNFYFHTSLWCLKRFCKGLKKNLLRHHKEVWN